jgi:hypothetical protein
VVIVRAIASHALLISSLPMVISDLMLGDRLTFLDLN